MALNRQNTEKKETKHYDIKVIKAKDISPKGKCTIAFDMEVNGIKIYGCYYKEGKKENGEPWALVDLPSQPGKDSNGDNTYWSIVWFPIDKGMIEEIADKISFALDKNNK